MPSRAASRKLAAIIAAQESDRKADQATALRRMAELDYIIEGGEDWTSRTPINEAPPRKRSAKRAEKSA